MPAGRPTIYTQELADAICERVANGETVSSVCRDENMPGRTALYNWINSHPEFCEHIERARDLGADAIADEALAIADDNQNDTIKGRDGQKVCDTEWVTRSRLRVETRLKLLAKWHPKRYGERLDVTSGDKPLVSETAEVDQAARLASIMAAAAARKPAQEAEDE